MQSKIIIKVRSLYEYIIIYLFSNTFLPIGPIQKHRLVQYEYNRDYYVPCPPKTNK